MTIALPSKGRLKNDVLALFARAKLPIKRPDNERSYRGKILGMEEVEIVFLSASEIAHKLATGTIVMGITGEDLARETTAHAQVRMLFAFPLGFGHANVVVAVPQSWIDVDNMADLDDVAFEFLGRYGRRLRIATKYWRLTQNFFADHGIALYRIVESLGATEAAPAAGTADGIVDISSTGSTLSGNHLKILSDGIILMSEANLILSHKALAEMEDYSSVLNIGHAIATACKQTPRWGRVAGTILRKT